jgi:hypothetical protein
MDRRAMDSHGCRDVEHVGDGVYAGFDGYQVWLVTDRGSFGGLSEVALEPGTYQRLRDYVLRLSTPQHHDSPKVG